MTTPLVVGTWEFLCPRHFSFCEAFCICFLSMATSEKFSLGVDAIPADEGNGSIDEGNFLVFRLLCKWQVMFCIKEV